MRIYKILNTSTSEQKYPLITEAEDLILYVCHTHTLVKENPINLCFGTSITIQNSNKPT